MLNHAEQIIIDSLKKNIVETRIVCLHMLSDTMEDEFCRSAGLEYLDKQSSVMSGPRKIRSRGSWSHIVSKATDA